MKITTALCLPVLVLPAAAMLVSATPRFAPAPGLVLRKSFEVRLALALSDFSSTLGGMQVPRAYLPKLELELAHELRLVVLDEHAESAGGRPLRLVREYREIAEQRDERMTLDGEDAGSFAARGASELEGRRVAFVWDAETDAYARAFEGGGEESDAALLAGLAEDLDLRALLPEGEAAEGDAWELDEAVLEALLEPGGELALRFDEERDETPFAERARSAEGRARLGARSTRDGRELVRIELEGTAWREEERATTLDFVEVVSGDATETRSTTLRFEGALTWDLAAGHALSLELAIDARVEALIAKDPGQEGPSFDTTTVLTGEWSITATFEPAD
jgi:hypothetical protein